MDAKELAGGSTCSRAAQAVPANPTHTAHGAAEGRSRGGAAGRAQAATAISATASTMERNMLPITQDYRMLQGATVWLDFRAGAIARALIALRLAPCCLYGGLQPMAVLAQG